MKYSFVDVFWGDLGRRLDLPPYIAFHPAAKQNSNVD